MGEKRMWKKWLFLVSLFFGLLLVWNTDASADYREFRGTVKMKVGQEKQFEALDGAPYYWSVQNATPPDMLYVEPKNSKYAKVKAQRAGRATLCVVSQRVEVNKPVWGQAQVVDRIDTWTIIVEEDAIQPTGIKLNCVNLKLAVGAGHKLTYTLSPAGASTTVSFTSSNSNVASVDAQTGYITAKNAGNAKITARTLNGIEAVCQVKVSPPAANSIRLNKKSLTVEQGKTKKLTATISPAGATGKITWKSSKPKVATVKNGKVKGVKPGSATITAKLSSKIYTKCKVTVSVKLKSIKLNKKKLTLTIGQKKKLTYKLSPKGAKSDVSWSSGKKGVASVDQKGNITAKKAGTATITVKAANGKKASCKVTVKAPKPKSIKLNKTEATLEKGKMFSLECSVTPSYAEKKITWSTDRRTVADVSPSGKVTAKGSGTAVITAQTSNGKKATCRIIVKELPSSVKLSKESLQMEKGDIVKLSYTLSPAGAIDKVSWSSSDSSIVSVDRTGKITANNPGTATITVKCPNGPSASCKVTVVGHLTSLSMKEGRYIMERGESQVIGYNATPEYYIEFLKWTSSNPEVATVDQNGTVKAKTAGTTTITVAANDYIDSCKVTVTEPGYVDISYDHIYIYDNYYTYGSNPTRHPYDPEEGITVVQSDMSESNSLDIRKEKADGKDMHVTLAGVELWYGVCIYAGEGDVYLELLEGTDNGITSRGGGYMPLELLGDRGGRKIYITGNGNLDIVGSSHLPYIAEPAIYIAYVNVIISATNITASTSEISVFQLRMADSSKCVSSLTILPEARVTAIGGDCLVEAADGTKVNIAPGSVTYLPD